MTVVTFFGSESDIKGFRIAGHCTQDAKDLEGKLLCSAVSSAAYMTANTLTEITHTKCDITERDGYLELKVLSNSPDAQTVLAGFLLHMRELSKQYSNNILVNSEV